MNEKDYAIMDRESFDAMETFAHFGKAMYLAQVLEMGIAIYLSGRVANLKADLTKDRYDELLTKKTYQTFGQLKAQFFAKGNPTDELKAKINLAHEKRDWIAHNYWWDRSNEFCHFDKRQEMKVELEKICDLFEDVNEFFTKDNRVYLESLGANIDVIFEEIKQVKNSPTPTKYRRLSKNEKLKGLFLYQHDEKNSVPLFILEDNSYWTLCESGLSEWMKEVVEERLLSIKTINSKCPMEFNPFPKTNGNWNYEIVLKSGFSIKVQSIEIEGYRYKWNIVKK